MHLSTMRAALCRKFCGAQLSAVLITLLLIGVWQQPAWAQSASTSNSTAVHPERGGLMLGNRTSVASLFILECC
jgi:hypothetical protein